VLLLGEGDATQRRSEIDPDPVGVRAAILTWTQLRVVEGELTRDHAELAEAIELPGGLRRHPRERVEVVDLCSDLTSER